MPTRKKKKFIDKKHATSYQLIPGYQEDSPAGLPFLPPKDDTPKDPEARREEQRKFGIFYNDDYDYMKHLRAVDEKGTLVKDESFKIDDETLTQYSKATAASIPFVFKEFFSTDETEEERIDPEVLAALDDAPMLKVTDGGDDDEDGDDFLDDDFVAAAGGALPMVAKTSADDDEYLDEGSDRDNDFDDEEDGGSFGSFDGSEDGFDSDQEDVPRGRGTTEDEIVEAQTALILRNFEEGLGFGCAVQNFNEEDEMPKEEDYENLRRLIKGDKFAALNKTLLEVLEDPTDKPKMDAKRYLYDDEDEYEWKDAPPSKPKFDCVSILSLNSNTRNLPTDLIPPRKESKSSRMSSVNEAPETNVQPGLSLAELESEMRESRRADKASTFRPKDETVDEKKARKKAIKDERKERRQEKKANKTVFSQENEKMKKETAALSKSGRGVTIT